MDPMEPMIDPMTLGAAIMEPTVEVQVEPVAPGTERIGEDDIRDMILQRQESSRAFYQPRRDVWDKCWNHYKQVYDTTNKESWQSTTFIPVSPKVAEVITANMQAALLAPDRPVEYQERAPMFADVVRDANDIVAVDMEKSMFRVHWTDILRSACIIGTGVGKIEYTKEYADVTLKERVTPNPMMERMRTLVGLPPAPQETTQQKRMLVKDYASIKYVDRYDCFPEPGTTEISKDKWFIERGKICNYKLLELMKDPEHPLININDDLLMNNPRNLDVEDKAEKNYALDEPSTNRSYLDPDQEHELLEYWGPAPLWMVKPQYYGDESKKYEMTHAWFWLIDGQYVVRRERTPWRDAEPPYVKSVYIRVPGQFDGIGPLELCAGLQVEVNEGVNCRQDEINLKLNKPIAVLKDKIAQGDWERLVAGPGAIWPFANAERIGDVFQTIDYDGQMQDSWRSTQMWLQEIQEVTAAVKSTIGAGGDSQDAGGGTFRGQLLNKQAASERFLMYARVMEWTGLSPAYRKMYARAYQYKDVEQIGNILGEERMAQFKFISPEELDLVAKVVPLGVTSMENKGVQLAQMIEEFKVFSGKPWFKEVEAARKIVVQRGQGDADTIIFSEEEMKIFNEQRKAMIQGGMMPPPPDGGMPGGPPTNVIGGPPPPEPAQGPGSNPMDMGMPAA